MSNEILYTNVTGSYVFNKEGKKLSEIKFAKLEDYKKSDKSERALLERFPGAVKKTDKKVLEHFRKNMHEYKEQFYNQNIELTKESIKQHVSNIVLIIQCINNNEELDKIINTLTKRLREWYSYYLPEAVNEIADNERFIHEISEKSREELLQNLGISEKKCMGSDLSQMNMQPINNLVAQIQGLNQLRKSHLDYLERVMNESCPNLATVAGVHVGAKLIAQAGSLARLAGFPASTIQLLGAEKALFRHMKTGAKSPKHGIIIQHPLVQGSKNKGRMARAVADKISLAAKVDYFNGEYIGDKLKDKLEKIQK